MSLEYFLEDEKKNYEPNIFYNPGSKFANTYQIDKQNYYVIYNNDQIEYRYQILKILGKGAFGTVVLAFDHKLIELKAIKIIRKEPRFDKQALKEIEILEMLNLDNKCENILSLVDHFMFRGHRCLVFPYLGNDLYSKYISNKGFNFHEDETKYIIRQVLSGLRYIKKFNVIHCDLKPENILLFKGRKISKTKINEYVVRKDSKLVLIDFGSSMIEKPNKRLLTYIQSRWYRAPEVPLGGVNDYQVSTSIDMWSLGCIIFELLTGTPLFNGKSEADQVYLYHSFLGYPEDDSHYSNINKFFIKKNFDLNLLSSYRIREKNVKENFENKLLNYPKAREFILNCLTWNPIKRLTPYDGLMHVWLKS